MMSFEKKKKKKKKCQNFDVDFLEGWQWMGGSGRVVFLGSLERGDQGGSNDPKIMEYGWVLVD
jgi:hypothetical protein